MAALIDPQRYYRLPWTLTDNAISWLEVTTDCNLTCEGCYRDTESTEGHKSLQEIAEDLDAFAHQRKSDVMSVAGGDPLVHPEIVRIVEMIKERGWKPIINTNGLALSRTRLKELKRAGVYGFTFHIDTSQDRKDAKDAKTEADLNALRQKFAEMLAAEGDIACSFNQTVTMDTLPQVSDVMRWAMAYPNIVHSVVFILYREPRLLGERFVYYANGNKIAVADDYKRAEDGWRGGDRVTAPQVVDEIRKADPEFEPCAYLGGSVSPNSTKWLLATRVANQKRGFGYMSPRYMEVLQKTHHMVNGTWLAYSTPETLSMGRSSLALFSTFDGQARRAMGRFLKNGLRNPKELAEKAYTQSFLIIQPIDLIEDGRADMCDGCPDMTIHKGKLYYSCRLEEVKRYGGFVTAFPRPKEGQLPLVREPAPARPSAE